MKWMSNHWILGDEFIELEQSKFDGQMQEILTKIEDVQPLKSEFLAQKEEEVKNLALKLEENYEDEWVEVTTNTTEVIEVEKLVPK